MKPGGGRRKGHDWEREVARLFREVMPGAEVKRTIQSRDGAEGADVDVPVFWLECKRGRKPNIRAALEQAYEATDGRWPVAVIKDDRRAPFVALKLEHFLAFIGEWWRAREEN